jgi:hypothetical protein
MKKGKGNNMNDGFLKMEDGNNKGEATMDISYIITGSGNINMVIDGESYVVDITHKNYNAIMKALSDEEYEVLPDLMDIAKAITHFTEGRVMVVDGGILYDGREVISPLTDRILNMMDEGMPFKPLVRFLDNLMQNPSSTSIQELYLFLEANTLPITPDGCFLAYKRVNQDYTDCYTGTIDNSVGGEIPPLLRNQVDDNRERTCSFGYHFCSMSYLTTSGYGGRGNPIMILKVNPKDVVSIPSDYNNQKGRCTWYEVVAEHKGTDKEEAFDKTVHDVDGGDYNPDYPDNEDPYDTDKWNQYCPECGSNWDGEYCDDCHWNEGPDDDEVTENEDDYDSNENYGVKPDGSKFHNVRDSKGRFVKKK